MKRNNEDFNYEKCEEGGCYKTAMYEWNDLLLCRNHYIKHCKEEDDLLAGRIT